MSIDAETSECAACHRRGCWTQEPALMDPGQHYVDYTCKCGALHCEQVAHDDDCPQSADKDAKCKCGFK